MTKPIPKRSVAQFFSNKLRLQEKSGKHEVFRLPEELRFRFPLTLPVALQHGRGDVSPRIVRQISDAFGVSDPTLRTSIECNIAAQTIFLSFLSCHLKRNVERTELDPPAMIELLGEFIDSTLKSLPRLFLGFEYKKFTDYDAKLLAESILRLQSASDNLKLAEQFELVVKVAEILVLYRCALSDGQKLQ